MVLRFIPLFDVDLGGVVAGSCCMFLWSFSVGGLATAFAILPMLSTAEGQPFRAT
jgi:hypothetical protein